MSCALGELSDIDSIQPRIMGATVVARIAIPCLGRKLRNLWLTDHLVRLNDHELSRAKPGRSPAKAKVPMYLATVPGNLLGVLVFGVLMLKLRFILSA